MRGREMDLVISKFRESMLSCTRTSIDLERQRLDIFNAMGSVLNEIHSYLQCARENSFDLTLDELSHFSIVRRDKVRLGHVEGFIQGVIFFGVLAYALSYLEFIPYINIMLAVGLALAYSQVYSYYNGQEEKLNQSLIKEFKEFIQPILPKDCFKTHDIKDDALIMMSQIQTLRSYVFRLKYSVCKTTGKAGLYQPDDRPLDEHELSLVKQLFEKLCKAVGIGVDQFKEVFPAIESSANSHRLGVTSI